MKSVLLIIATTSLVITTLMWEQTQRELDDLRKTDIALQQEMAALRRDVKQYTDIIVNKRW